MFAISIATLIIFWINQLGLCEIAATEIR